MAHTHINVTIHNLFSRHSIKSTANDYNNNNNRKKGKKIKLNRKRNKNSYRVDEFYVCFCCCCCCCCCMSATATTASAQREWIHKLTMFWLEGRLLSLLLMLVRHFGRLFTEDNKRRRQNARVSLYIVGMKCSQLLAWWCSRWCAIGSCCCCCCCCCWSSIDIDVFDDDGVKQLVAVDKSKKTGAALTAAAAAVLPICISLLLACAMSTSSPLPTLLFAKPAQAFMAPSGPSMDTVGWTP